MTATLDWTETRVIVSTCNLNQWALDFDGNLGRTIESIREAKRHGARLRVGPELELSGYSCEDHFLEIDTFMHCEQSLAAILDSDVTDDILCDIGMPIMHNNVRYNCKVFCCNRRILFIRPKANLANDGNYHEPRFFSSWKAPSALLEHTLSPLLAKANGGQRTVPIGMAMLQTAETMVGCEICEELWAPNSPHVAMALSGAEIFVNGSGSHHSLRKLEARLSLMQSATVKCGGVYLYSNHRGCDGTRLYFDGSSLIVLNGKVLSQASQFSLQDVEVVSNVVDLADVRSFRNSGCSIQEQSSLSIAQESGCIYPTITTPFSLVIPPLAGGPHYPFAPSLPIPVRVHCPEEECLRGPACWLWDYLRRSGASGFLLPLSGGADSSSVCAIVFTMCLLIAEAVANGDATVEQQVKKMWPGCESSLTISTTSPPMSSVHSSVIHEHARALCNHVLTTVYIGTDNSSSLTRDRASSLSKACNSYHSTLYIDTIIRAVLTVFMTVSSAKEPRFLLHGGTKTEDLALQNIQARLRMVVSYFLAQLLPWVRGESGYLLVLSSSNVDECLRGYMTKYDCSSADINPIGGICKADLTRMMCYAADNYQAMTILKEIADAPPTAELQPIPADASSDLAGDSADTTASRTTGVARASSYSQLDEEDMGMTYAELRVFGMLRKVYRCGPVTMFRTLVQNGAAAALAASAATNELMAASLSAFHLNATLTVREIAVKVKRFFYFYAVNRHKMTTITPSYHAESYSPDDNRFDFRPFLYSAAWTRQNRVIDKIVDESEELAKTTV